VDDTQEGQEGTQEGQEGQEGTEGTEGSQEGTEGQEGQDSGKTFSEDYVKTLRKESAGYRTRAQTAEGRIKELEGNQSEELTTISSERDDLRTENESLKERVRRSNFIETIGLPTPRLAYASLNDLSIEVEYDDDYRPKNLEKVRKALKQEFPREFGDGSADGGASGNGDGGYDGTPGIGRLRHAYGAKE